MTNEWALVDLGDGINVKHGFAFKGEHFSENGSEILLTPGNFYEEGGFKYTPGKEKYYIHDYPSEYLCERGDLVVAMTEQTTGLLGSTALVPENKKFLHNQRIGLITYNVEKYDKLFLYYVFRTKHVRAQIARSSSGSKVKHTSPDRIYDVKVQKTPLEEQKKIGGFLYTLDKKIELNNKINVELEAMAKLIYDYWFVQFDFPSDSPQNKGKPYKSSGGKMVFNEALKREIPDGWAVEALDSVEPNIVTGKTPPTKKPENFNGNVPFICIGDVRGNMHITKTELALSDIGGDSQVKKYIPEGSICVTCIASPGLVGFATEKSQTNQQLNTVVCSQFENQYFLYFYLKDYFRFAKAKSGNTFANMNKGDFSEIKVIHPKKELLEKFADNLKPTIDKILVNSKENNKLIELRDWLLPMLMNGQVTVK